MVLAQLVFRGWAVSGSWFYGDDYEYLRVAEHEPLNLGYLVMPHGGHLLPMTRLTAGWLARSGETLNWPLAATSILLLQACASLTALWMFVTLFGRRWAILAPLGLYLTSAITIPAMIWWAAALNQLGHQAGLFLAVAAWIRYERSREHRWAALVLVAVSLSFFCDARGLFIPPLLAMLSVGWFATGSLAQRIVQVVRRNLLPAVALGAMVVAYWVAYSRAAEENLLVGFHTKLALELFDAMIGTAFGTGIVGGPWHWNISAPPTSFADPPDWSAHLAWVVIVLVVLHAYLTRLRALRAFAMAATYISALYLMVLISRAPVAGAAIGTEYRYLTDAAPIMALALGLAYLQLIGSGETSRPRPAPMFTPVVTPVAVTGLVSAVAISGLWSSFTYVKNFQNTNAAEAYVSRYRAEVEDLRPVDLVDQGVPPDVVTPLVWPQDALRKLSELLGADAHFPKATHRLGVVTPSGRISFPLIENAVKSPPGPVEGCGWKVAGESQRIPLTGEVPAWGWWMRIGYLAGEETNVVIRAGSTVVESTLRPGLNSLFVQNMGGFDSVYLSGIDPVVTVCVDTIEVGKPVPGNPLQ